MDLNVLWFCLIGVLFGGFFFLEGFDFGVGMWVPFLGRNDLERRVAIHSIGPVWDANEVWLLTAGGAMFATFPGWYATLFSGGYLALFLVLAALIVRGVSFEFRGRVESRAWKKMWDAGLAVGSLLPPLLLGVAMADLLAGLPINAAGDYAGNFWNLLTLQGLLTGVMAVSVFLYHGAVYLSLKVNGVVLDRARKAADISGIPALALASLTGLSALFLTDAGKHPFAIMLGILAIGLLGASYWFSRNRRHGCALLMNGLSIAGGIASLFAALFPRVMVSTLSPDYNLTIYNSSSTPYTLKVISIITLTVLPIVIGYFLWTYRVFRHRVDPKKLEY
jgi:cytochrome d ubiquinol oxidase subunit II